METESTSTNACRLCLRTDGPMEDLLSNPNLLSIVFVCTQLKVQNIDGMPTKICANCKSLLGACTNFKRQCHIVDQNLKRMYGMLEIPSSTTREAALPVTFLSGTQVTATYGQPSNIRYIDGGEIANVPVVSVLQNQLQAPIISSFQIRTPATGPIYNLQFQQGPSPPFQKCGICGAFVTCLIQHNNIMHTDAHKFECDLCHKKFNLKQTLINHRSNHARIKAEEEANKRANEAFRSQGSDGHVAPNVQPQASVAKAKPTATITSGMVNQAAKISPTVAYPPVNKTAAAGVNPAVNKTTAGGNSAVNKTTAGGNPAVSKTAPGVYPAVNKSAASVNSAVNRTPATVNRALNNSPVASTSTNASQRFVKTQSSHANVVPRKKQKFACDQCDDSFSRITTYQLHLKMHRNANRFDCLECDETFSSRALFIEHRETEHYGERNYRTEPVDVLHGCQHCDTKFRDKDALLSHLQMLHAVCKLCGEEFHERDPLLTHIASAHYG